MLSLGGRKGGTVRDASGTPAPARPLSEAPVSVSLCLYPQPHPVPGPKAALLPTGPRGSSRWDGSASISESRGGPSPPGGILGLPQLPLSAPSRPQAPRHGRLLLQAQARYLFPSRLPPPLPLCLRSRSDRMLTLQAGGWLEPSLSGPRGAGGGNSSGAFLRKGRGGFLLLRGAGGPIPSELRKGALGRPRPPCDSGHAGNLSEAHPSPPQKQASALKTTQRWSGQVQPCHLF